MESHLYQVVLTGRLISGFGRDAALAALARMFDTSAARFVPVLDGAECPIDDLLDADRAGVLQRQLEQIGVQTRVDHVAPGREARRSGLGLPRAHAAEEAGMMRCPACGHHQLVASRCDECGVVFSEYNRRHPAGRSAQSAHTSQPRHAAGGGWTAAPRPRDIHARASAKWREEWVDDGDAVPTEQYHMQLFIGPRAQGLSAQCQRMMLGRRTRLMLSWVWGAVISPFLWAMYRKMWAWGLFIFLVEILAPVVLITLGTKQGVSDRLFQAGVGLLVANRLFWPLILKNLYCRHVRRTIAQMNRMSPTYASDIEIAHRGGTSRTSVLVGVVMALVVSLLAWSVIDTLHAQWLASARASAPPVLAEPASPVPQSAAEASVAAQNAVIANENKWVATRNRLRLLGQRISAWFADGGRGRDPATLDLATIEQAIPLAADDLVDGWGRRVAYRAEGRGYRLVSAGPDGQFDSADDVEYRRILER